MNVSICGIPYKIIECDDNFDIDLHFGEIKYGKGEIYINKSLSNEIKDEALCHEILHGILVHLGYIEQSQDEQFVQAVGNAIYQTFQIKKGEGVMIPEREREALMRLAMCAREECSMCKYQGDCNFDFQYELATKNMNILAEALRETEPTSSKNGTS